VTPDIDTYIGAGAAIEAGGGIALMSLHNYADDGSVIRVDDDTRTKGAIADSTASGGGAVGVSPASATATAHANVPSTTAGRACPSSPNRTTMPVRPPMAARAASSRSAT
jgi:hypothetical protein